MKKKRTFAYLGTHEIGKTTVASETIKCGLYDVVGRSEQLVCDCKRPNYRWIGDEDDMYEECFNCRKDKAN